MTKLVMLLCNTRFFCNNYILSCYKALDRVFGVQFFIYGTGKRHKSKQK